MNEDEKLEGILRHRKREEPSSDLAARIIQAAEALPQIPPVREEKVTLKEWLGGMLRPKPAFALAVVLVLGFAIGYWANLNGQNFNNGTQISSLLYNEEEILWVTNSN